MPFKPSSHPDDPRDQPSQANAHNPDAGQGSEKGVTAGSSSIETNSLLSGIEQPGSSSAYPVTVTTTEDHGTVTTLGLPVSDDSKGLPEDMEVDREAVATVVRDMRSRIDSGRSRDDSEREGHENDFDASGNGLASGSGQGPSRADKVGDKANQAEKKGGNREEEQEENRAEPSPRVEDSLRDEAENGKDSSSQEVAGTETEAVSPILEERDFQQGLLASGTMLGHFRVVKYIGGGGMGRVYLATDTALDRKVAIKVLPRQRANDQGVVARFMNEARSAARLNHEHIAQVYFAGEHNGIPYIAFEYVEGTNIRSLVEEYGPFPIPQAVNFLIQISHALAHASLHGVVHRDVKPSNILITNEGSAKLIDMGLARLLNPSESREDLTASGVTLGTFDYISPEQARDPRNADIRSDIYSLGCTFFYMLAGQPPFPEGTVLQKLLQHQGDLPPDIREFQPEVPAEIAQLIQKMMAKDPRQRFQTPTALIDALVVIAEMLGLRPSGPGRVVWVLRPQTRRSRLFVHLPWMISVFVLLLTAFLLNLSWGDRASQELLPGVFVAENPKNEPIRPLSGETSSGTARDFPRNGSPQTGIEETPASSDLASGSPGGRLPGVPSGSGAETPTVSSIGLLSTTDREWGWERYPVLADVLKPTTNTETVSGRLSTSHEGESGSALCVSPTSFEIGSVLAKTAREAVIRRSTASMSFRPQWEDLETTPTTETTTVSVKRLVVDPEGELRDGFRTLDAALSAVEGPARIEIRSNRSLAVSPLIFASRELTIAPASGYTPSLVFGGGDGSWTRTERAMMTLGDCTVHFEDLTLEFRVPRDAAWRWSLFEIPRAAELSMKNCDITIRNTSVEPGQERSTFHQEVAFFRCVAPPLGLATEAESRLHEVGIRLDNVVVRGEATVLHAESDRSVSLTIHNAFIASSKPLLFIETPQRPADSVSRVRLSLARATVYLLGPFIRQNRTSVGSPPPPLPVEVDITDSLLALNGEPLLDYRGIGTMDRTAQTVLWQEHGAVFYNEVPYAWKLKPLSNTELVYTEMKEEWRRRRGVHAQDVDTPFERSFLTNRKPISRLVPSDFTLRAYAVPSSESHDDGKWREIGQDIDRLPKVSDVN